MAVPKLKEKTKYEYLVLVSLFIAMWPTAD